MKKTDVIVIGGSAAGLTAAITAKRHYPNKSVLCIRQEKKVSIPCGIPYAFGVVGTPEKNLIPADESLAKSGVDSLVGRVVGIDRDAKTVTTDDGAQHGYERLIVATGSNPIVPPLPGHDMANVFAIRKDVDYLAGVIAALDQAKGLCIVGCGFIGVEIAEECKRLRPNLKVNIVEMLTHCLQLVYDEDFCLKAEETLRKEGIDLQLDAKVAAFEGDGKVERVRLADGNAIEADIVIVGIGAAANADLAREAGLEIDNRGSIRVNRYMQTSDPEVFACGDCADKVSFFDGKPSGLKLASIATMEARIAGANLFSISRANRGVIGVYSTVLGDSAFAVAGLTVKQARDKGYNVVVGEAESSNRHPGCMPGGTPLRVRLVFEAGSQVIIGGQVIGAKSGGELINAISACIHQRMTADDIATFQTGTHPALTASPIAYQLVNAAELAIAECQKLRRKHR
ncbi:MAG: FAD-dependent oxidoreductase [Lentisphaerae bacterium]|nr:FAD-dependent oxidoreductase [Lentisphaerota bacterium]